MNCQCLSFVMDAAASDQFDTRSGEVFAHTPYNMDSSRVATERSRIHGQHRDEATRFGQVDSTGIESTERKDLLGDQMNVAPLTEPETFFEDAFGIALSKRVMRICKDQGLDRATGRGERFFQGRNESHTKSILETGTADQDRPGGGSITTVDIIAICTPELSVAPRLQKIHTPIRAWNQYTVPLVANVPKKRIQTIRRARGNSNVSLPDWYLGCEITVEKVGKEL